MLIPSLLPPLEPLAQLSTVALIRAYEPNRTTLVLFHPINTRVPWIVTGAMIGLPRFALGHGPTAPRAGI